MQYWPRSPRDPAGRPLLSADVLVASLFFSPVRAQAGEANVLCAQFHHTHGHFNCGPQVALAVAAVQSRSKRLGTRHPGASRAARRPFCEWARPFKTAGKEPPRLRFDEFQSAPLIPRSVMDAVIRSPFFDRELLFQRPRPLRQ